MNKSMLDEAYEIIKDRQEVVGFAALLAEIGVRLGIDEEVLAKKASVFYTQLLRDGRFVTLGENTWDLRTNHKFDKVHIDMNDIYHEDEDDREDLKDKTIPPDNDLYDALLESDKDDKEDDSEDSDEADISDESLTGFSIHDIDGSDDDKEE